MRLFGQTVLHTGQYPAALPLLQTDITDVDQKVRSVPLLRCSFRLESCCNF
jgi:hypothetical protein